VVRFPDVPGTITDGRNQEEALAEALDALETKFDYFLEEKLPVPLPSKVKRGQPFVTVPANLAVKVLLHNEMLAQNVRPAELARRLHLPRQEMTRLLDPATNTKLDLIAKAFVALGKSLAFSVA